MPGRVKEIKGDQVSGHCCTVESMNAIWKRERSFSIAMDEMTSQSQIQGQQLNYKEFDLHLDPLDDITMESKAEEDVVHIIINVDMP